MTRPRDPGPVTRAARGGAMPAQPGAEPRDGATPASGRCHGEDGQPAALVLDDHARDRTAASPSRPADARNHLADPSGHLACFAGDRPSDDPVGSGWAVGHLRDAIPGLKHDERLVLTLYYGERLEPREIGAVLGLTESRVSRIRSKALSKLRDVMVHHREGTVA